MYIQLDPINRLHLQTFKSILGTLSLLPASYLFHHLWFYSTDSDQVMIRFFALSVFISWALVAFSIALSHTATNDDEQFEQHEQKIMSFYRQIPLMFFTGFIVFLQSQFC